MECVDIKSFFLENNRFDVKHKIDPDEIIEANKRSLWRFIEISTVSHEEH